MRLAFRNTLLPAATAALSMATSALADCAAWDGLNGAIPAYTALLSETDPDRARGYAERIVGNADDARAGNWDDTSRTALTEMQSFATRITSGSADPAEPVVNMARHMRNVATLARALNTHDCSPNRAEARARVRAAAAETSPPSGKARTAPNGSPRLNRPAPGPGPPMHFRCRSRRCISRWRSARRSC